MSKQASDLLWEDLVEERALRAQVERALASARAEIERLTDCEVAGTDYCGECLECLRQSRDEVRAAREKAERELERVIAWIRRDCGLSVSFDAYRALDRRRRDERAEGE